VAPALGQERATAATLRWLDGTPKKVSLHKGPNNGLYYVNEAGNKVYGTPAARGDD
jgi:hypothetical protein